MIVSRQSGARQRNADVAQVTSRQPSNAAWVRRRAEPGAVLLLGGSGVIDFRLRVAQSHLRDDLLPSFWSIAGILVSETTFLTVPIDARLAPEAVPGSNAIHDCRLADYDDPRRYPNVAVIHFADAASIVVQHARRLFSQRSAVDLPHMLVAWLGFVWGAGAAGNPLLQQIGIPGAALVETAYGMAGVELTPGIASTTSCPEAIWQSAIWWHEYYERAAAAPVPAGRQAPAARDRRVEASIPRGEYIVRQPAAAVVEIEEAGGRPAPRARQKSRRR